jgi:hypothetical protein
MPIDVLLDDTGDLPRYTVMETDPETLTVQRLGMRLRTFLGEWILDQTVGLPFVAWSQKKPTDTSAIALLVRREIETCPGVRRVDGLAVSLETDAQRVTITGRVVYDSGATGRVVVQPFGVQGNPAPIVDLLS